jgi:hypothetical protein
MKPKPIVVMLMCCLCSVLVLACAQQGAGRTSTAPASGKVYAIGDMPWPEVDALGRDKTLFLLTVGMLEEHGPHLPVSSDTIAVEYEARLAAGRLSRALPDWNVVVMPTLNYGSSGANQVGQYRHPRWHLRATAIHASVAARGYRRANRAESLQVDLRLERSWSADPQHCRQRSVRFRQRGLQHHDAERFGVIYGRSRNPVAR